MKLFILLKKYMGNNNYIDNNKKVPDNKNDLKTYLTRNHISDISTFYNYEKKYEGINNAQMNLNKINNNYVFIICGLIDGFIIIYNIIDDSELKLSLNFKAHQDLIIKINQLKHSGYLLTSSYDNSLKVFKLSRNCTQEELIYKFYLNPIFNRINDLIQINNDDILLISVFNHIIYFPYIANNLSENKVNLSDYIYSKIEHGKKYLSNLLQINEKLFIAIDEVEKNLLFFKLIPSENISQNIIYLKSAFINIKADNNDNNWNNKICIENLLPKYNYILMSFYHYFLIIDIKYMEIISIHETKMNSFYFLYNDVNDIIIFEENNIFRYKINIDKYKFNFIEENKKGIDLENINGLQHIRKSIYNPLNNKIIFFFYKSYLMKIDLNF